MPRLFRSGRRLTRYPFITLRTMRATRPSLYLALAVVLSACKVTAEDVDTWKGTVKGPGKMVAVMLADKYDMGLRIHSALAMVEMERQDVDGVAELQRAIQKVSGDARSVIIDGMTPGLIALMNTDGADSVSGTDGPAPTQIRAKDAAFLLIPNAGPESRAKLTDAVVGWYVQDFNGRNLSGNFSAEQVIRALGAPAAQKLVEALNAKVPQQALIKLSELIGQLGDEGTRGKAAQKLVAIEQEMRGKEFKAWLEEQIREQMKVGGGKVDEKRVDKAATVNQQNFIESGAIPAMKYLADQPPVASRLLEIAEGKRGQISAEQRARALMALEGQAKQEHLDRLLALALNSSNPERVRDYAFDRVGDVRSARALPAMWPLVQSTSDERLRWRAGELVLAIGGNGVVAEFFSKLPSGAEITYEPEELEGYATRMGQMTPQPTDLLRGQLGSANWWDQVIALKYFERKGGLSDIPAMKALSGSKTGVAGDHWGKTRTVGKVAEEAIAGLRERVKQASAGATSGSAS